MKCTWKNCSNKGRHKWKDRFGRVWATLCDKHNEDQKRGLQNVVDNTSKANISKMLSNWIKSQGGAKNMV